MCLRYFCDLTTIYCMSHMITSIYMYIINITCDKDKVNEMKLLMLMLMNALMMLVLIKCKRQMQCLTLGCYTASVLHRSRSLDTNPLDLHLRRQPPPPSSTPTHHKPRDMFHNPTHAMVSSQIEPKMRITLTITHYKSKPQGHISTLCSQSQ